MPLPASQKGPSKQAEVNSLRNTEYFILCKQSSFQRKEDRSHGEGSSGLHRQGKFSWKDFALKGFLMEVLPLMELSKLNAKDLTFISFKFKDGVSGQR